jgi:hypothetical protein
MFWLGRDKDYYCCGTNITNAYTNAYTDAYSYTSCSQSYANTHKNTNTYSYKGSS